MRRVSSTSARPTAAAMVAAVTASCPTRSFIVPPPAPAAPHRFATYGDEGRQDVQSPNTFMARQGGGGYGNGGNTNGGRAAEESIIGNTTDEDDLEGTMLQGRRMHSFPNQNNPKTHNADRHTAQGAIRLPGVGGNSAPIDQLPRPPFEEYGTVLEAIRQATFRQSVRKQNKTANPSKVNPNAITIVAVSLGWILNDLSPDVRRLLKNPLFSGLESTLRSCPMWFEVSQDSLQARLTSSGHQWGTKTVPTPSVPIPAQIEQAMLIDQRQRSDAAAIRQQREEAAEKERKLREDIKSGAIKPGASGMTGAMGGEGAFKPRKREKFANPFAAQPEETSSSAAGVSTAAGMGAVPPPPAAARPVEVVVGGAAPAAGGEGGFKARRRPGAAVAANSTAPIAEGTAASSNTSNTGASEGIMGDFAEFGAIPAPPPPSPPGNLGAGSSGSISDDFADFGAIPAPPPPSTSSMGPSGGSGGSDESVAGMMGDEFAEFGAIPPPPPPAAAPSSSTGIGGASPSSMATSAPAPAAASTTRATTASVAGTGAFRPRARGLQYESIPAAATPAPATPTPAPAAPTPAAPAPVERKPLLVSRSKYSTSGRIKASENIAFERVCKACTVSPREMMGPEYVAQGGTKKPILSKDSKLMGVVDLSIAPLNLEEIAMIPVLKAHCGLGGPYIPDPSHRKLPPPPAIFPKTMQIPTLPELEFLDMVYERYSKIHPSQMAFALFEFVPTFFVEIRQLLRIIPLNAMTAIFRQERKARDGKLQTSYSLFRKYSTLFEVTGIKGGADRPAVRINWKEFPYLRRHPRFGMADKHMRRFSMEREGVTMSPDGMVTTAYSDDSAANPLEAGMVQTQRERMLSEDRQGYRKEAKLHVRIFYILLSHMPRTMDARQREGFVNVVQWINSFPPEDLAVINEVSQERVIRIILKYPRIFQLSSSTDDPNLYSANHGRSALAHSERLMGKRISSSSNSSVGGASGSAAAAAAATVGFGSAAVAASVGGASPSMPAMGDVDALGRDVLSSTSPSSASEEVQFEEEDEAMLMAEAEAEEDVNMAPQSLVDFDGDGGDMGALLEEEGALLNGNGEETSSTGGSPAAASSSPTEAAAADAATSDTATTATASATAATNDLGVSSFDAIAKDADLSEADKGRVKQFNASLEDGLIGMDDILLSDGAEGGASSSGELMDRGENAEEYKDDELTAAEGDDDAEMAEAGGGAAKAVGGAVAAAALSGAALANSQQNQNNNTNTTNKSSTSNAKKRSQQQDDEEGFHFTSEFDCLQIRRIPRHIAPRSLCDCDYATSPNVDLMRTIMSHVPAIRKSIDTTTTVTLVRSGGMVIPAAPVGTTAGSADGDDENAYRNLWRWISLEAIYKSLSPIEKRELRPFRGLANFMRLHGKLCEVSEDSRYVIAHDPNEVPPLIPTLRFFNIEERLALPRDFDANASTPVDKLFGDLRNEVLGYKQATQIPTTRVALQVMDPKNPLLDSGVMYEEIANFLPDHPVLFRAVIKRLPPLLRACLPTHVLRSMQRAKTLSVIQKGNAIYLAKRSLGEVENADVSTSMASLEETIEAVKRAVNLHGSTKIGMWIKISYGPRNYIKRHYENLGGFVLAFPKVFYVENHLIELHRLDQKDSVRRMRQLVHLVANAEAREKAKADEVSRDYVQQI